MFGGIGFMLNGNLVAAVSKRGLLVRVGKNGHAAALARPGAHPMAMPGRTLAGYVRVDLSGQDARALATWIGLAVTFVATLPAKVSGPKPKRSKGKRP
jgi:TfoX/Sxy family transcriptional regulator of competence genes